jgi:hypothetical protein
MRIINRKANLPAIRNSISAQNLALGIRSICHEQMPNTNGLRFFMSHDIHKSAAKQPNRYSASKRACNTGWLPTGFGCVCPGICCILYDYDSESVPGKGCVGDREPKVQIAGPVARSFAVKHYSLRTEEAYGQWVRRYLRFHRGKAETLKPETLKSESRGGTPHPGPLPIRPPNAEREKIAEGGNGRWRHPRDLGAADVVAFLNHLADVECVAAGTQNQALNAISFLYTQVSAG